MTVRTLIVSAAAVFIVALCACREDASNAWRPSSSTSNSGTATQFVSRIGETDDIDAILGRADAATPACRGPMQPCSRPAHRCCGGFWCVFRECVPYPPPH
jgi:hypothetical protein